ncbi:MAG: oligosaccharide flippase family protein [Bacilli bacterium]|nr:oligosaccharide flippase family protein [Bacilli bacterium]
MRTKNSIKNSLLSFLANLIAIIIGFIAQNFFITILGTEYLGINGLFTNIVTMLGIAELGIGTAIIYNLYKPLANNDTKTIKSLMQFYKKAYRIIALIIFLIGILIMPFLPLLINGLTIDININIIYFLFIFDIICYYLNAYKRSILYADQKNYIVNITHMIYLVLLNILQLGILYYTKDYYIYLIIKIIMRILENLVLSIIVNKKYNYLNDKNVNALDKNLEKDIIKKVKAIGIHKASGLLISGTDNIIISKFIGIITVGLYSNYYMIINAVQTLFGQAITALTPSVGNLLISESHKKRYDTFKKIRFANFWIACITSIALLIIITPFITIWLGDKFLLEQTVLIVLVFNFFQNMMKYSYICFKDAAGIYYEDRFIPIIESLLNIILSIIFVKIFGLVGVFLGTIISGLIIWCYSYPKYIYKNLFNRTYLSYAKETLGYILLFIITCIITYLFSSIFGFNNIYITLIINILICLTIPNIILFITFHKTDNFKYYITKIKK